MRYALFLTLLLASCAPLRGDDDDAGGCETSLQVCVFWDTPTDPVAGSVEVRNSVTGAELSGLLGDDGCVAVDLTEGLWEWRATNTAGDCVSAWEDFTIDACSSYVDSVDLTAWCMDGREDDDPGEDAPGR